MDGDDLIRSVGDLKLSGVTLIKPCDFCDLGKCQLIDMGYGIQSGPKKGRCKTGLLGGKVCPGYVPRKS